MTLWEYSSTGIRKLNETYIFENTYSSMEFSKDGKIFIFMLQDYKTCLVYDALTLNLISKWELKGQDSNGYDLTYFYNMYPSFDGSYLLSGDSYSRWVFDNQGKFIKWFNGGNAYTMYMYSKNEYLSVKGDDSYTKTNLVSYDFINGTEKVIHSFDSYITPSYFSPDYSSYLYYDSTSKYWLGSLKGNKEKIEIFKEYVSISRVAFKGDKLAIVTNVNYQYMNITLYEKDKALWKQSIMRSWVDIRDFKFSDELKDTLVMIEYYNSEYILYYIDSTGLIEYPFKAMRDVIFCYPYLIYGRGTKEIWVQDMNNIVQIYYFDGNISAIENTSKTK